MIKIPLVDLQAGFRPIQEEVMNAVREVFQGMNLYLGPHCQAFEQEFAEYCGTDFGIAVGSGTEAILFALLACGITKGDEVITSPHSFFATAEAIVAAGAKPVFVDIDPVTYNIDPDRLEENINSRTKAIVPVHMYGQTADLQPIMDLAGKYGVHVIEDACQSHGALYSRRKSGSVGNAGCFSFYFTKNLGGYGEGGMVVTSDRRIYEKIRLFRNHGHRSKYEHAIYGYNGRLDEIQAAILRIKLKYLDQYNNKRRAASHIYRTLLQNTPVTLPQEGRNRHHVYHLYVIRSTRRDALQKYLGDSGIGTGIHYKIPIHLQEAARDLGYRMGDFPAAEAACSEILSLPIFPELDQESQRYIAEKIKEFYSL